MSGKTGKARESYVNEFSLTHQRLLGHGVLFCVRVVFYSIKTIAVF